jgi:argininosuccinate lyase
MRHADGESPNQTPEQASTPVRERQWGGRFATEPDRLVREFTQSIEFDRRLFGPDILGSVAHCRMLTRQGILTEEEGQTIVRGLCQVGEEAARGEIVLDHALEDVHTHVESRLRELVGPVAGKLHTARSRNDQIALDLRLFLRDALLDVVDSLAELQTVLHERASAWHDVVVPGFTHTQRAQPVLLAHHLLAYHEMFRRDAERLQDAYPRLNVLSLGAGALAGVAYAIDRHYVAELLGFDDVSRNSLDTVGDRDFVIEFLADASLVMAHLSRLAEEIVLWTTSEFGYLVLDDSFTTGSSIMPQKKNSDVAELVRGKVGRVYGHLIGLLVTVKALPLAYNRDIQEDKEPLFDTVDTLIPCLQAMAGMLRSATIRKDRLTAAAAAGFSLATDVADYLVVRGLPFRQAHQIVGEVVRHCLATGHELSTLPLDDYRAISPLFDADVLDITVLTSVQARDQVGGTAPNRVALALVEARQWTDGLRAWSGEKRERVSKIGRILVETGVF